MGICSSQMTRENGNYLLLLKPKVMIIHLDGRLQELKQPIKASQILSQHPNSFLCNSESMFVDSIVPQIPDYEELELGQIYFLLPLSKANKVLSLQDLCGLAIKASLALGFSIKSSSSNVNVNNVAKLFAQARSSCRILTGLDALRALHSQARRDGGRRLEFGN